MKEAADSGVVLNYSRLDNVRPRTGHTGPGVANEKEFDKLHRALERSSFHRETSTGGKHRVAGRAKLINRLFDLRVCLCPRFFFFLFFFLVRLPLSFNDRRSGSQRESIYVRFFTRRVPISPQSRDA